MARSGKTTKTASTKGSRTRKTNSKKIDPSYLLNSLPDSVENIEIVQQVACIVGELQNRVLDVKEEANKELKKLMKRYESNYKGIEKKLHQVTSEAKKQAQASMIHILQKWHEHKEKLPKPLAKEVEKLIEQIGTKVITSTMTPKKSTTRKSATSTSATKKRSAARQTAAKKKSAAAQKKVQTQTRRKTQAAKPQSSTAKVKSAEVKRTESGA